MRPASSMVLSAVGTAAIALARTPLAATLAIAGDLMGAALVWPGLNSLIAAQFTVPERPRAHAVRFGFMNAGFGTGALFSFLVCVFAFVLFGYAQLDGPWAAFATGAAHSVPRIVGTAFAVNTAVIVAAQLAVTRLTRRWRRSRVLFAAGACWTVAWVVTALPGWHLSTGVAADAALVVSLGIYGLGETLWIPVRGAIPNELAAPHLRVRYNALSSTVRGVGVLVGPPIAGALLGGGVPSLWVDVTAAGMAVSALVGWSLSIFLPADVEQSRLGGESVAALASV